MVPARVRTVYPCGEKRAALPDDGADVGDWITTRRLTPSVVAVRILRTVGAECASVGEERDAQGVVRFAYVTDVGLPERALGAGGSVTTGIGRGATRASGRDVDACAASEDEAQGERLHGVAGQGAEQVPSAHLSPQHCASQSHDVPCSPVGSAVSAQLGHTQAPTLSHSA